MDKPNKINAWLHAHDIPSQANTLRGAVAAMRSIRVDAPIYERGDSPAASRTAAYRIRRLSLRAERIARGLGAWDYDVAHALARDLSTDILAAQCDPYLPASPHCQTSYFWAGAGESPRVQSVITTKWVRYGSRTYPRDAHLRGVWIMRDIGDCPRVVGGLVTAYALYAGRGAYYIGWLQPGRGNEVAVVYGWLIDGHHIEGGTLRSARIRARRARKPGRAIRAAPIPLDRVWVSVDDSLRGGNCQAGTQSAASRICLALGGEVGAVRADVLKAMPGIAEHRFIARAIRAAASR